MSVTKSPAQRLQDPTGALGTRQQQTWHRELAGMGWQVRKREMQGTCLKQRPKSGEKEDHTAGASRSMSMEEQAPSVCDVVLRYPRTHTAPRMEGVTLTDGA